jgi:hypothetical protein
VYIRVLILLAPSENIGGINAGSEIMDFDKFSQANPLALSL